MSKLHIQGVGHSRLTHGYLLKKHQNMSVKHVLRSFKFICDLYQNKLSRTYFVKWTQKNLLDFLSI